MAESFAHQFGQIIGEVLENAVKPYLQKFAQKHGLYLDGKGFRPARSGKKVTWQDHSGNVHDLDFVLERGGTPEKIGMPVAFIEVACRRYTKHSRNKAQEIQGAILPLKETYSQVAPVIGVVLAGVFTKGALDQLRSLGFSVLYFPYESVIAAFQTVDIEAGFEENTRESEFRKKLSAWKRLSRKKQALVSQTLLNSDPAAIQKFLDNLEAAVNRRVILIRLLPLHGQAVEFDSLQSALKFIAGYDDQKAQTSFVKFEIQVRYSNGDQIQGEFRDKKDARSFLQRLSSGN